MADIKNRRVTNKGIEVAKRHVPSFGAPRLLFILWNRMFVSWWHSLWHSLSRLCLHRLESLRY
jgi:hypothetical protein